MIDKINQIQELLSGPNVDTNPETAIANMKILNLLVSLRADAEKLDASNDIKYAYLIQDKATLIVGGLFAKEEKAKNYIGENKNLAILKCYIA